MNQDTKTTLEIDRVIHQPARLAILTVSAASIEIIQKSIFTNTSSIQGENHART